MESASDDQQPSVGPKRDSRLPTHLAQYNVTRLPSQQPAAQASLLPIGHSGRTRSSRAGSVSDYQSIARSQRSPRLSEGSQLLESMPDVTSAVLEEWIKGMELTDLQQEIEEERQADLEAKRLDAQAREGQRLQEEAHIAKEMMAKEMGWRRRLKKLEKEVKIASAVKSFLSESEEVTKQSVLSLSTSDKLLFPTITTQSPIQVPVLTQHAPLPKQSSAQLPFPVTVPLTQTISSTANPVTSIQTSVPMSAILAATADPITVPPPSFVAPISQYAPAAVGPQSIQPTITTSFYNPGPPPANREPRPRDKQASVLCSGEAANKSATPPKSQASRFAPYCPFCNNKEHYLNSCPDFKKLSTGEIKKWIQEGDRCFKCGRSHRAMACTLKRPCKTCKETHVTVLHDTIQELSQNVLMDVSAVNSTSDLMDSVCLEERMVEDKFACPGMFRGSLMALHSTVERIFSVHFSIGSDQSLQDGHSQIWLKLRGLSSDVQAAKLFVKGIVNQEKQQEVRYPPTLDCIFCGTRSIVMDSLMRNTSALIVVSSSGCLLISGLIEPVVRALSLITDLMERCDASQPKRSKLGEHGLGESLESRWDWDRSVTSYVESSSRNTSSNFLNSFGESDGARGTPEGMEESLKSSQEFSEEEEETLTGDNQDDKKQWPQLSGGKVFGLLLKFFTDMGYTEDVVERALVKTGLQEASQILDLVQQEQDQMDRGLRNGQDSTQSDARV